MPRRSSAAEAGIQSPFQLTSALSALRKEVQVLTEKLGSVAADARKAELASTTHEQEVGYLWRLHCAPVTLSCRTHDALCTYLSFMFAEF
jgi:hypothetical protein